MTAAVSSETSMPRARSQEYAAEPFLPLLPLLLLPLFHLPTLGADTRLPSGRRLATSKTKQAVDLLVQELCTGPASDVTTVIRTALERGYRNDLQVCENNFGVSRKTCREACQ